MLRSTKDPSAQVMQTIINVAAVTLSMLVTRIMSFTLAPPILNPIVVKRAAAAGVRSQGAAHHGVFDQPRSRHRDQLG